MIRLFFPVQTRSHPPYPPLTLPVVIKRASGLN